MKTTLYLLLTGLICLGNVSFSQTTSELKAQLKSAKSDTLKSRLLIQLTELEEDPEIWHGYNNQLGAICNRNIQKLKPENSLYKQFQEYNATYLSNEGAFFFGAGDHSKAIQWYEKSLELSESMDNYEGQVTALINMGGVYQEETDFNKAFDYFKKALKISENHRYYNGIAHSGNNLAYLYQYQGNVTKAVHYSLKSLNAYKKNKDLTGEAMVLNSLGFIYDVQGNLPKAKEYYFASLRIYQKQGNLSGIGTTQNNIGYVYGTEKKYQKALFFYNRSLKIREQLKEYESVAGTLNNIGDIYELMGEQEKALDYLERSLAIRIARNDAYGMANSYNNLGSMYEKLGQDQKALAYFEKSLELSNKIQFPEFIRDARLHLYQFYKKTGKDRLALANYEGYIKMKDSLYNLENKKAVIELETRFEYEKKRDLDTKNHQMKLKQQKEKAKASQRQQTIITFSILIVLVIVGIFLGLLYKRFKISEKQKRIIEEKEKETNLQKHLVEEKQREIVDSITYAKRLQEATLPSKSFINEHLPRNLILYKPKDIVAGDFYWAEFHLGKFFIAAADSTGHGVPGAMVSVVCSNALNRAVKEFNLTVPGEILDKTQQLVIETFEKNTNEVKDGMDISLICFDPVTRSLSWAGANNPLWYSKEGRIVEIKADKQPIGKTDQSKPFTTHQIEYAEGMTYYLFTDGYADQFGGPKGKKFKYKQLEELFIRLNAFPLTQQEREIEETFDQWKGHLEQVDDVCIIAFQIS